MNSEPFSPCSWCMLAALQFVISKCKPVHSQAIYTSTFLSAVGGEGWRSQSLWVRIMFSGDENDAWDDWARQPEQRVEQPPTLTASHKHHILMAADLAFCIFCCSFWGVAMIIKKKHLCGVYSPAKVLFESLSLLPFSSHYVYDAHCLDNSWVARSHSLLVRLPTCRCTSGLLPG